ncbi:SAM-dependent methyltransferase [Lichenibacterium ramalinae]|uniref:Methyltransferase domain-containing protein n=1 Tax=Lichenibacterium ramalinae TaxID=2316527 RepID=A0A4Q2R9A9_9HYPH|nr:SAM-dependent methyltransferase [Lichenibacterium ramalinae]RYB02094.1 methyltransferase domain-containing protein [Lichenibacterium ramalinae]
MRRDTLGPDHFEALYAARPDPWCLASSDYERAKYAATLAALPRHRYARGFEVGCAIGILTAELGRRCADLLAVEPVAAALAEARARNAGQPHIRFAGMFVPGQWPAEPFDLVVLSEVIDYLGADDVEALAGRVLATLAPGGDVVMVHWVGKKRGPPTGDEASDRFVAAAGPALRVLRQDRNPDYRLDVLRRV